MVRNEGLPDIRCCNRIIHGQELSIEEMRLLETDGAARGETELALASPLGLSSVDCCLPLSRLGIIQTSLASALAAPSVDFAFLPSRLGNIPEQTSEHHGVLKTYMSIFKVWTDNIVCVFVSC